MIRLETSLTISTEAPEAPWTRASLRVSSNTLTAERIIAAVGTEPSAAFERGTPRSRSTPAAGTNEVALCIFESGLATTVPLEEHLAELAEFVASNAASFAVLSRECDVDVFVGWAPPTGQSSIAIPGHVLATFASLGAEMIFDVYVPEQ